MQNICLFFYISFPYKQFPINSFLFFYIFSFPLYFTPLKTILYWFSPHFILLSLTFYSLAPNINPPHQKFQQDPTAAGFLWSVSVLSASPPLPWDAWLSHAPWISLVTHFPLLLWASHALNYSGPLSSVFFALSFSSLSYVPASSLSHRQKTKGCWLPGGDKIRQESQLMEKTPLFSPILPFLFTRHNLSLLLRPFFPLCQFSPSLHHYFVSAQNLLCFRLCTVFMSSFLCVYHLIPC